MDLEIYLFILLQRMMQYLHIYLIVESGPAFSDSLLICKSHHSISRKISCEQRKDLQQFT